MIDEQRQENFYLDSMHRLWANNYSKHVGDSQHLQFQLHTCANGSHSVVSWIVINRKKGTLFFIRGSLFDVIPVPLTGVGGGPVEEDGQSVARRPIREVTKRQLSPGDMAHVDEEGVVGGVEAAGEHTGVLIHPTVQQSPGQ